MSIDVTHKPTVEIIFMGQLRQCRLFGLKYSNCVFGPRQLIQ